MLSDTTIRRLNALGVMDGTELWQKIMAKKYRKTLVLCVECHQLLHEGNPPDWKYSKPK